MPILGVIGLNAANVAVRTLIAARCREARCESGAQKMSRGEVGR